MAERDDLVAALRRQRDVLTATLDGMSDAQARSRPTVSTLCLGGLIKHVGRVEAQWMAFLQTGAAATTDELVLAIADLDAEQPLPDAPWFEPGASWSARRVILHLIAEAAQHCGHADLLREAIGG